MKEINTVSVNRPQFVAEEISVNSHGRKFDCICGIHLAGKFVAIVNWGVTTELSDLEDNVRYNAVKILSALKRSPFFAELPKDEGTRAEIATQIAVDIGIKINEIETCCLS